MLRAKNLGNFTTLVYPIGLIILVSFLSLILQPRLLGFLPIVRQIKLEKFLSQVKAQHQLDPKAYWQWREFYNLGHFSFDPLVVTWGETQIIKALPSDQTVLLKYDSVHFKSTDYLIKKNQLPALTTYLKIGEPRVVVFSDPQTLIVQNNQEVEIVFVKSIEEMRAVNGFFDYTPQELKLLEDRVWLNITQITI